MRSAWSFAGYSRGRAIEIWAVLLLLACAVSVGVLASLGNWLALLIPIVPILAYHTVKDPVKGLVILAALISLENAVVIPGIGTGAKLAGLTVAGAWILGKLARRGSWRGLAESWPLRLSLLFSALVLASMLWAAEPMLARSGFIQLAQLIVLSALVLDICRDFRSLSALAKGLVLGALVAATITILEFLLSGVRRAGDSAAGINGTAELLVTLLPLAFYLVLGYQGRFWRFVGLVSLMAAVGAVSVTLSRMSVLLLPIVLLVLAVRSLRSPQGRRWLVPVLGAVMVAGVTVVPWGKLADRSSTIVPYLESTVGAGSESDDVISGRGYHLLVAWRIFEDHPLLGAGYNNYGWYFYYRYQHSVAGRGPLYESFRSPHSSHFGILSELGIGGLVIWLGLLGAGSVALVRALRLARSVSPDFQLIPLGEAFLVALLIQVGPYALYGPNHTSKLLWVLLGAAGGCTYGLRQQAARELGMSRSVAD